jgi:iron complex outermembrane recepter protein
MWWIKRCLFLSTTLVVMPVASMADTLAEVTVSGRRTERAAAAVAPESLQVAAPTVSPFKLLETVPGVNISQANPNGQGEFSARITMRGFQTPQIGQTLDGVPLGDMNYGNWNGLHVNRAIDVENLARIVVTQGSGALGTASANNLGGVIQYFSRDPADELAVWGRATGGSFETKAATVGVDSGQIGALRGYLTFTDFDSVRFKGPEDPVQWRQVNAKAVADLEFGRITAYFDYSNKSEHESYLLSFRRLAQSGYGWDHYASWQDMLTAYTTGPALERSDAYYRSNETVRQDRLGYLLGEFRPFSAGELSVMGYAHHDLGKGYSHPPTATAGVGADVLSDPAYFRITAYDTRREGVIARYQLPFGARHRFEAGVWHEWLRHNLNQPWYSLIDHQAGPAVDINDVRRVALDRTAHVGTSVVYAQNETELLDARLRLTYGVKMLITDAKYRNEGTRLPAFSYGDLARPSFDYHEKSGLLPSIGLTYALSENEELFGNLTVNENQLPLNPLDLYGVSLSGLDQSFSQDQEQARVYEMGVRTGRGRFEGSLATYYVDYRNRLLPINNCAIGTGAAACPRVFDAVGDVESYGAEASLNVRFTDNVSLYQALAVNHSAVQDDYISGDPGLSSSLVRAAGKSLVDAPKMLYAAGLRYVQESGFFGGLTATYKSKRYVTFENDQSLPALWLLDASAGHRFGAAGPVSQTELQIAATNLLDEHYIAATYGNAVRGDAINLLTGAPRAIYVSLRAQFR